MKIQTNVKAGQVDLVVSFKSNLEIKSSSELNVALKAAD